MHIVCVLLAAVLASIGSLLKFDPLLAREDPFGPEEIGAPRRQHLLDRLSVVLVPSPRTESIGPDAISGPDEGVVLDFGPGLGHRRVAWPQPSAGLAFLVKDGNSNGVVDHVSELVSNRTIDGVSGAFQALIKLEGSGMKHELASGSPLFHQLLLWTDSNKNGKSDAGEMQSVVTRFARIGLGYSAVRRQLSQDAEIVNKGWGVTIDDLHGTPEDRLTPLYEVRLSVAIE